MVTPQNEQGAFEIVADEHDHGKRLDFFVADLLDQAQRSRINELAKKDLILVNGRSKKPSYKIKAGDTISGTLPQLEPLTFKPEKIDLDILYEDNDIIVINKQPGLVVHPAPGHWTGTLVNGLMNHCPDMPCEDDEIRPGIVHRLDRDTSGVMVAAKTRDALFKLSQSFQARHVSKSYLAIVHGSVKKDMGIMDLPIGRHPVHRKMMSTRSNRGKHAETHYCVESRYRFATCLKCDIKTGRTHQIRVHCHAMGHPLVGDALYSSGQYSKAKKYNNPMQRELVGIARQMLHSHCLIITHPATNEVLTFYAPMPEDMKKLLVRLEQYETSGTLS